MASWLVGFKAVQMGQPLNQLKDNGMHQKHLRMMAVDRVPRVASRVPKAVDEFVGRK